MTWQLALLFLASYFVGSIPFGVLIARQQGVDIFKVGSGNIGATNVMRALGKKAAFAVFFLDVLKGLLPTLAARWVAPESQAVWFAVGIAAVVGHCLSPFLKFKGGKGISTTLGVVIGTSPLVALVAFSIFALLLMTVRYMSLSSMVAVTCAIPLGFVFKDSPVVIGGYTLLSAFVIYRHRPNIKRLKEGTEPKFSFKKTTSEQVPREPEPEEAELVTMASEELE